MSRIKLLVGLGNPGFWWIDKIATQTDSKLALEGKFYGIAGKLNTKAETWLLKPTTFMNASGKSVAALANYYKISPSEILVIHDELDLPVGSVKLKMGGGHGGHNGLKDIEAALGTKDFWRLRIGIGHPGDRNEVVNFVLKAPTKDEETTIDEKLYESTKLIDLFLNGEFENAMLKLHTKK
jgi:PTH1 family peptidyl-tRNA hydrolase